MRLAALLLLPALAACASTGGGSASSALSATPNVGSRATAADEAGPLATVQRLNDAMRLRDTALLRTTFHQDARLVVTTANDGRPIVRVVPISTYIASIGGTKESLDERMMKPSVQVDDNVGSVWVRYAMYRNGHLSHCGANAYQLVKTGEGWKIMNLADTQRRDNCDNG